MEEFTCGCIAFVIAAIISFMLFVVKMTLMASLGWFWVFLPLIIVMALVLCFVFLSGDVL